MVLIFVFEYVLLPEIATARRSVKVLGQVNVAWLILAVLLELGALLSYAELTRTVLSPDAPRRFRLFRINMSSLAASHVLPGGTAPGTAVSYRLLLESGVPGSVAGFGLATQGVGSAVVLNAIFWLALIISIPFNGFNPLYGVAAVAGLGLLAAFAGTVFLFTRGKHGAADRLRRVLARVPLAHPEVLTGVLQKVADRLEILLRDRRLLVRALLWAAANWILDAASLWVFLCAFGPTVFPDRPARRLRPGQHPGGDPGDPGGLGVVEVTLTATLVGFGVPRPDRRRGRAGLEARQLLAAHPRRRALLRLVATGPPGARRARALRQGGADGDSPLAP